MKHKTWFRLVIKAIGVLLVGLSFREILYLAVAVADTLLGSLPLPYRIQLSPFPAGSNYLYWLPDLAQFAFGLYLFFGGKWIVDKCIPSNRPYCPECGYDVSHLQSSGSGSARRCPECGVELPTTIPPQSTPTEGPQP